MTYAAHIEANRKNAQRSTGPRTDQGKERSRFNALKDGASARSPVIPGEDAAEFQNRIDTWTASLSPTNEVDHYVIEHAARASWQLDRIDRAHAAHLASSIRNTDADAFHQCEKEVAALGRRRITHPRNPTPKRSQPSPLVHKSPRKCSPARVPRDRTRTRVRKPQPRKGLRIIDRTGSRLREPTA